MMSIHPDQVDLGEISIRSLWNCPAGVSVGDAVYQTGVSAVDLADSTSMATMPCVGIVVSKPSATSCYVTRQGVVNGYPPTTFVPKETMYVGFSGGLLDGPSLPTTPGSVIQEVGFGKTDTDLVVILDRDYTIL